MRVHPGPGPSPDRSPARPSPPVRAARPLAAVVLIGLLTTACATVTPGRATPAAGATTTAGAAGVATSSTRTAPPTTTPRSTAARSTAVPTSPPPSSAGAAPSTAAAWSVVPPAALQAWESVPADDVSQIWRSGNCLVVVSAPTDVPDMTDERFARAHVRYAVSTWISQVDPAITDSGDYLSKETDPLRVSDPTRTEPPTVHLQLSGFHNDFPAIGLTDQTYSFVTQGGGQGLVVSTVCSQADFAQRYDTEIAPLIGDLGVDTGI